MREIARLSIGACATCPESKTVHRRSAYEPLDGSSRFVSFEAIEMEIPGHFESRRERTNSLKDIEVLEGPRETSTQGFSVQPWQPIHLHRGRVTAYTTTAMAVGRAYVYAYVPLYTSKLSRFLQRSVSLSRNQPLGDIRWFARALSPTRVRVQSRSRSPSHSDLHPHGGLGRMDCTRYTDTRAPSRVSTRACSYGETLGAQAARTARRRRRRGQALGQRAS